MGLQKYCYIVVRKENGNMLHTDEKLPVYWHKKDAALQARQMSSEYIVHKIELTALEKIILISKKA